MAYIPPAKRNQASASYSQASYEAPSFGTTRRADEARSWKKGGASSTNASSSNERRVVGAGITIVVPLDRAKEWKALDYGDITVDNVTKDQLYAWRDLVLEGKVTHMRDVEAVVKQLEPISYVWATNVILEAGSTVKGISRADLLLQVGIELRYNDTLAGDYYTPVPYKVYGNFGLWKDKKILRDGGVDVDYVIKETPAISVLTALVHQAWLATGRGRVIEEFPLTAIHWGELIPHLRHVDFLSSSTARNSEILIQEYRNKDRTSITLGQYSLITAGVKDYPHIVVHREVTVVKSSAPVSKGKGLPKAGKGENTLHVEAHVDEEEEDAEYKAASQTHQAKYASLIGYDVGTVKNRSDMTRAELYLTGGERAAPSSWDADSGDEEEENPGHPMATRLVSSLPGDERDAMFFFSSLVEYYSKTPDVKKALKLRILGLQKVANPLVQSEPYPDFVWPIMRELLYSGRLSHDYSSLALSVPDYREVAKNLSRHLSPSAFAALRDFLVTAKADVVLLDALHGKQVDVSARVDFTGASLSTHAPLKLPSYSASLPTLIVATREEIEIHNQVVTRYNRVHGADIKKKREEAKRKQEEAENKKQEEKRRKENERKALLASMTAKKEEAQRKRDDAVIKKRKEDARKAEEYKRRMMKHLPTTEDEE